MAAYQGYDLKVPMYNPVRGFRRGVMQVDVQMATDIKGDKICGYGKASPYVQMIYGVDKKTLTSAPHEGSSPIWNQRFVCNFHNASMQPTFVHFEIWNYHRTRKDNQLGRVSIENLPDYIARHPYGTGFLWLPIFRKGVHKGDMMVRFYFECKEDIYFGDGQYENDRCVSYGNQLGPEHCVVSDKGIRPHYIVLEDVPVAELAGSIITLQ
ncbi:hypothetical protein Mapa_011966 [Marchantia paleacea]|nr:hypothetical protein Mapa_011966 [Marchantia paleacea]